jgi:DNA-binding NarL/FixJ family response regulator
MHSIKTFIVEDSSIILDNLVAALEELTPVRVVGTAGSERAAVRWLLEPGNGCELVIVDVFLRSGSGLGVLAALARIAHGAHRLVLTNYASRDMRQRCLELGAHRVFDKSKEAEEMLAYCANLGAGETSTLPAGAAGR